MTDTGNGWSRYEKQVLYRLETIDTNVKTLDRKVDERIGTVQQRLNEIATSDIAELRTEIAMLKVKAGIWGGLAGIVPFGLFITARLMGA